MKLRWTLAALPLLLAACGQAGTAENKAATLEDAAEQSTPEAAEILQNRADEIRDSGEAPPGTLDDAMQAAGNAQAPQTPPPGGQGATPGNTQQR